MTENYQSVVEVRLLSFVCNRNHCVFQKHFAAPIDTRLTTISANNIHQVLVRNMVSERALLILLWILHFAVVIYGFWFGRKDKMTELQNKTLASIQNSVRTDEDWIDQYIESLSHNMKNNKISFFTIKQR